MSGNSIEHVSESKGIGISIDHSSPPVVKITPKGFILWHLWAMAGRQNCSWDQRKPLWSETQWPMTGWASMHWIGEAWRAMGRVQLWCENPLAPHFRQLLAFWFFSFSSFHFVAIEWQHMLARCFGYLLWEGISKSFDHFLTCVV